MNETQALVVKFAGMATLLVLAVVVNETGMRYGRRSWQRFACRTLASALLAALVAVALAAA